MDPLVLLDAGPFGLACCDPGQPLAGRCQSWLDDLEAAKVRVLIPAITDYEVRRELLRVGATVKLRRLAVLRGRFRLLDIAEEALDRAASFWATLRRAGLPTAADGSLDADAILAGMAATVGRPGEQVLVATSNLRHLSRFPGIDAREWDSII